jgi:DNA-directed RNA polymerase subunit RPC12/RpoP
MELDKVVNGLEKMLEESKYNDSVQYNPWADTETLEAAIALLKAQEPHYPVCERCGKPIDSIKASVFRYDGTDSEYQMPLTFDEKTGCVGFETTQNWTGYELTDEERKEGIRCPHCGEYPFDNNVEIEFHEPVEVLMWTSQRADSQRDYEAAVEMAEYCERYEPTCDPETGAM